MAALAKAAPPRVVLAQPRGRLGAPAGVLAHSNSRLMVLLGVNDIVAVDTPDALLIIDRARSQETRRVTEELKRRGLSHYL